MEIFNYMDQYEYEQLVLCHDKHSGLKAIIAIHDTTLGPALGGLRIWPYETEEEAIEDALRLARGMTYKNAAAGLDLGGGKSVIIADAKADKNEEMLRAFGRYVQSLNGRYITAEDVGASETDMDTIHKETHFVTGISKTYGSGGNPAPVTAYGIFIGIKASAKEAFGSDDLKGKKVAVQGVGNVAFELCRRLHEEGAELVVTDINQNSVDRAAQAFNAEVVDPDDIYDVDCDIFSPCALGAVINDDTINRLKAKVVAGSANNQLKDDQHGEMLHQKGILYAPDYVINSGGVINVSDELLGYNEERALNKVETIYDSLLKIYSVSRQDDLPTAKAADRVAENRIQSARKSRYPFFTDHHHILSKRV